MTAVPTVNASKPEPPLASVRARLAALDGGGYDYETSRRQSLLHEAGLDWRTYLADWPTPSVVYDHEARRFRIKGDSGWLAPHEWLALCQERAA
ncbi:hypothetical protein [Streptomyces iranensis]|uniref:Uncharacterized protein n=1 Tax=Streptomyces iranensis TaxID=576784 RepID=A0ABS4MRS6_9ACTN|nr:hypothetical protein [Streptomyces iranensis]MBP2062422.1 hypothetical protein [Streptomyces iranensis]